MHVTFRFSCQDVSTRDLEELFAAAELGGRVGEKIRRAFLNSSVVCFAYDSVRLIGASRAITDGEYHGLIHDVAVLPEYQGRGIGRRMMQELLDRLPVWRVMLVADEGVQGFYRKLGFDKYPDLMAKLNWERLYDVPLTK
jgi:ribosomal protein S18 acetylase RimI-like enzyme